MHLDFRVKPENDRKDTFGTSPLTAALVEQWTVNPCVAGSKPAAAVKVQFF